MRKGKGWLVAVAKFWKNAQGSFHLICATCPRLMLFFFPLDAAAWEREQQWEIWNERNTHMLERKRGRREAFVPVQWGDKAHMTALPLGGLDGTYYITTTTQGGMKGVRTYIFFSFICLFSHSNSALEGGRRGCRRWETELKKGSSISKGCLQYCMAWLAAHFNIGGEGATDDMPISKPTNGYPFLPPLPPSLWGLNRRGAFGVLPFIFNPWLWLLCPSSYATWEKGIRAGFTHTRT